MKREHHAWYSERLGRRMELLLFGHAGEPIILFPTSRGRFYENEDFKLVEAMRDRLEAGRYVIVCVDSVDSEGWYNDRVHPALRVLRHEQYESYLLHEVVPFARSVSSGGRLALSGCSFGAFHAMQIGLRNPHVFQKLLGMSGKFDTENFLDGYHDQRVYFHSVFQWLPNLGDRGKLEQLYKTEIILATGDQDGCRPSSERLSGLLWNKGIGNHLSVWENGIHDWPLWRRQIREYFPW